MLDVPDNYQVVAIFSLNESLGQANSGPGPDDYQPGHEIGNYGLLACLS